MQSHTVINLDDATLGVSMQSVTLPYSLLHRAAANGDATTVEWLLTTGGVDINLRNHHALRIAGRELRRGHGETALHIAAAFGRQEVVRLLLLHNAPVNALDEHKDTPLHLASKNGHASAMVALLEGGAAWHMIDANNHIALQHACVKAGSPQATSVLLETMARESTPQVRTRLDRSAPPRGACTADRCCMCARRTWSG